MNMRLLKFTGGTLGCLAAIFVYLLFCGVSWIATCGVVKLVTLCFDWSFSWAIATGVWILWWIVKSIISRLQPK